MSKIFCPECGHDIIIDHDNNGCSFVLPVIGANKCPCKLTAKEAILEKAIKLQAERDALKAELQANMQHEPPEGYWLTAFGKLKAERDALKARLEMARDMLITCHDAIKSLPIDSLGEGEIDWNGESCKYPIRDELIDKINHALAALNSTKSNSDITKSDGGE